MNGRMKILVAYDGSECADAALVDLAMAGLPEEADTLVVTVAEVWTPEGAIEEERGEEPVPTVVSARAAHAIEQANRLAQSAADRITRAFPLWQVHTRVYADSPAWGVLKIADEWGPDLIVVGSHGRSALGRLLLGSVSQKVLSEAHCSVRIARDHKSVAGAPLRILLGVDGTPDSEHAVDVVASRRWPEGSSVSVVAALSPIGVGMAPPPYDISVWAVDELTEMQERIGQVATRATARLRAAGLVAEHLLIDGAPIPVLLDEARKWGADTIFLGARGHRFMERFLLGSVSASVAARATCSVEVVRSRSGNEG